MLRLNNISKTFHNSITASPTLNNINLTVNKGDFVSIIGSNGAGKTTLFNVISGSCNPDSGNVVIDGCDVTFFPEHKRAKFIGRLFQDPLRGTAPQMSILENLYLAYGGSGKWLSFISEKEKKFLRDKIASLEMGLENKMNQAVGLLSGGQRQALTLAMAIIVPPKLLLLDEHTAALDPPTSEKVMRITDDVIKNNSLTCLMITHNMQNAVDYGNRLIMMHNGSILSDIHSEKKQNTTVMDLSTEFKALLSDKMLL